MPGSNRKSGGSGGAAVWSSGVPRGVHELPFRARGGEIILVAISHDGRRLGEVLVPIGGSRRAARKELRAILDREDPVPNVHIMDGDEDDDEGD